MTSIVCDPTDKSVYMNPDAPVTHLVCINPINYNCTLDRYTKSKDSGNNSQWTPVMRTDVHTFNYIT